MSTAGEAASLFGPDDAATDPFAVALGSAGDSGAFDGRVGEQEQPAPASEFFQEESYSGVTGQDTYSYANNTNDHAGYASWYDNAGQTGYTGNVANDQYQHYSGYEQHYDQYNGQAHAQADPSQYATSKLCHSSLVSAML